MKYSLLALVTALLMAACAPAQPTTASTATSAAPTTQAPPTATGTLIPEGDADAPATYAFSGVSLEALDLYSAQITFAFMGRNANDETATLTTNAQVSARRDPFSQWLLMQYTASGVNTAEIGLGDQAQGQFSILVTPNTAYVTQNPNTEDAACVSAAGNAASTLITSLTSFDDLLGTGLVLNRVEPNEVIAGMESRHYQLAPLTNDQFTGGTLDVFVARDTGLVTRVVINGQGTFPNLGIGSINAHYELTSTQQTVDFSPPSECEALDQ